VTFKNILSSEIKESVGGTTRAIFEFFPGYVVERCAIDAFGKCGRKNVTIIRQVLPDTMIFSLLLLPPFLPETIL
jgi:hypothetical protein